MSGKTNTSGLPNSSPEAHRGELLDLVNQNRELFASSEELRAQAAILQMKPEQYEDWKQRITKQINFRRENNIHNAAT